MLKFARIIWKIALKSFKNYTKKNTISNKRLRTRMLFTTLLTWHKSDLFFKKLPSVIAQPILILV